MSREKWEQERDQKMHNEGEKDASKGRYSTPWANPFESHERSMRDTEQYKKGHEHGSKQAK